MALVESIETVDSERTRAVVSAQGLRKVNARTDPCSFAANCDVCIDAEDIGPAGADHEPVAKLLFRFLGQNRAGCPEGQDDHHHCYQRHPRAPRPQCRQSEQSAHNPLMIPSHTFDQPSVTAARAHRITVMFPHEQMRRTGPEAIQSPPIRLSASDPPPIQTRW